MCVCLYMHSKSRWLQGPEEDAGPPRTGVISGCVQKPNPGPLCKQQELLTTEQSLHLPKFQILTGKFSAHFLKIPNKVSRRNFT